MTDITEKALQDLQADNARLSAELTAAKAAAAEVPTLKTTAGVHERAAAELAQKLQTATGQLAAVTSERDTFKSQIGEFEGKVVKLTQTVRERDLIEALSIEAPQADRKVLHGLYVAGAEKGAFERFPEDATKAAKAAIEKLKAEAPAAFSGKGVTAGGTSAGNSNNNAPARPAHFV